MSKIKSETRYLLSALILGAILFSTTHTALAADRLPDLKVSQVKLFSFMFETGKMLPEPHLAPVGDDSQHLISRLFAHPVERGYVLAFQFSVLAGQPSGYNLPPDERIHATVDGRPLVVWKDLSFNSSATQIVTGADGRQKMVKRAMAWKLIPVDFICDPTDVVVRYRKKVLKKVTLNANCNE